MIHNHISHSATHLWLNPAGLRVHQGEQQINMGLFKL